MREYLKAENEFFLIKGIKVFDEDQVVDQMKRCRAVLVDDIKMQFEQLEKMIALRNAIGDPTKKELRA